MRIPFILIVAALLSAVPSAQQAADEIVLKPANHPRLAAAPSQLWMAPTEARSGAAKAKVGPAEFAAAVKLEVDGDFAKALPIFSRPAMQQGVLGEYAL